MKYFSKVLGGLLLISGAGLAAPQYSGSDKMTVPGDYRDWVFLTASLDLNYSTASEPSTMHMLDNVFVNPDAYKVFLKAGTWPDQTVMIKENRVAESPARSANAGASRPG